MAEAKRDNSDAERLWLLGAWRKDDRRGESVHAERGDVNLRVGVTGKLQEREKEVETQGNIKVNQKPKRKLSQRKSSSVWGRSLEVF